MRQYDSHILESFDVFLEKSFDSNQSIEIGLLKNVNFNDVSPVDLEKQRKRIKNLFFNAKNRYVETKHKRDKFEAKHECWPNTEFSCPASFHIPISKRSRQTKF